MIADRNCNNPDQELKEAKLRIKLLERSLGPQVERRTPLDEYADHWQYYEVESL